MKTLDQHYIDEINKKFESSWEKISKTAHVHTEHGDKMKQTLSRLHSCLKWSTAYAFLQSHCANIIKPYIQDANIVIKRFWVEYGEKNLKSDCPPTPKEFFEWYCDSQTIQEDRLMFTVQV